MMDAELAEKIRKIPEAEFIPTLRYELEHWNEQ